VTDYRLNMDLHDLGFTDPQIAELLRLKLDITDGLRTEETRESLRMRFFRWLFRRGRLSG